MATILSRGVVEAARREVRVEGNDPTRQSGRIPRDKTRPDGKTHLVKILRDRTHPGGKTLRARIPLDRTRPGDNIRLVRIPHVRTRLDAKIRPGRTLRDRILLDGKIHLAKILQPGKTLREDRIRQDRTLPRGRTHPPARIRR